MSGEQSSTPKRDQKPKTQEEMIISVASAVLEEKKKDKGVKVAAPEPFDGDRKETQRFLTKVEIYLCMHPTEYDTDEKKCLFFLSYLRGKDTQAWKQRNTDLIFNWKSGDEELKWNDLKAAFKKHYLPIDIKADAQLRIEEMKMGERADNYVNEFKDCHLYWQTRS
uniref:Retrotransposon gag domain-containing protein n=1 Tax=Moniliophthora roreri TaxID=221103 RepID=A0A0W0G1W4_MONRR